jgi:4,5-dihydroxyphthalate decarboxylase
MTSTKTKPPASDARVPQIVSSNGTASVHLTLAVCDYEHVREITQGLVRADGITLTPLIFPSIEEITFRFTKSLEWDVSELSFGKVHFADLAGRRPDDRDPGVSVAGAPAFRDLRARRPRDQDRQGPRRPRGRHSGMGADRRHLCARHARRGPRRRPRQDRVAAGRRERARAREKVELKLPAGIRYKARPDTSLSAMLRSGEVDAIISARAPEAFAPGGAVVRLFPDYRAEEERFYKKTGIFPIMHLMTMRRAAYEQHPWIAMNLYKMFDEAKRRCLARLRDFTCARIPLPWAAAIADEIAAGYGPDPYPTASRRAGPTLEAFCRYAHDQGVTHRRMTIDDLFPREVRAMARV